jgi:hypothetical protein
MRKFAASLLVLGAALLGLAAVTTNPGTTGVPVSPVQVLAKTAVPIGIAPTGTMANNGAITLGTAFAATYGPGGSSPGIWLNLAASAIFAGSAAGNYWTVMTSATLGTVFNNTYTAPGPLTPPTVAIPFVTTGPGAYTGVTSVQTLYGVAIPGGTLGPNGAYEIENVCNYLNSAGTKTITVTMGGQTMYSSAQTTSSGEWLKTLVINRGSQAIQAHVNVDIPNNPSSNQATTSVDTSQAQTLSFTAQLSVATDYVILDATYILAAPN